MSLDDDGGNVTPPDILSAASSGRPTASAFTFSSKSRKKLPDWNKTSGGGSAAHNKIPEHHHRRIRDEEPLKPREPITGELQKIMQHYGIDPNNPHGSTPSSSSNTTGTTRYHDYDDIPREGSALRKRIGGGGGGSIKDPDDINDEVNYLHLDLNRSSPKPASIPSNSEHNQRLASFGITISSALSNILFSHPFLVLRRQCQINSTAKTYHLTPFTVVSVALNLQSAQGFLCLWKGVGSGFWLIAIRIGCESFIHEMSNGNLPRDLPKDRSISSILPHLILKMIVAAISSPLYSVHLVECVQSDMTSETPSVFSCLFDAFHRVFHIGNMWSPRLLPFYKLLLPTIGYYLMRHIMTSSFQQAITMVMRWIERRRHMRRHMLLMTSSTSPVTSSTHDVSMTSSSSNMDMIQFTTTPPTLAEIHYPDLISSFMAEVITDVLLFPYETALNRIHIQGTRTIIDNTDTGRGFCSIASRYEGISECFNSIKEHEGKSGLYRGFGAMVLQHCFKYAAIRLIHFTLEFLST